MHQPVCPQTDTQPKTDAVDMVNHPPHYKATGTPCECGRPIEVIQLTENLSFCLGNAVKYICRCDHKGTAIEDLKKAAWYINRELERRTK